MSKYIWKRGCGRDEGVSMGGGGIRRNIRESKGAIGLGNAWERRKY